MVLNNLHSLAVFDFDIFLKLKMFNGRPFDENSHRNNTQHIQYDENE